MNPERKSFFLKLNPPRSTFMSDMTDEERVIMQKHVDYWAPYVDDGTVIVLGPVLDPKGGYGIAVIRVDNNDQLKELTDNDPANELNSYEIYPMRVVTKQ
ncbi:MAG: YciI family protein [Bacteroidales bacterium]